MIDFNKPVQTRDGRKVEIVSTKGRGGYPIVGYMEDIATPDCWTADGSWSRAARPGPHRNDIVNVPEKVRGWVNIYGDGTTSRIYRRRAAAALNAGATNTHCIYVEETDPPEEGK